MLENIKLANFILNFCSFHIVFVTKFKLHPVTEIRFCFSIKLPDCSFTKAMKKLTLKNKAMKKNGGKGLTMKEGT